jgi:hypothetical protein
MLEERHPQGSQAMGRELRLRKSAPRFESGRVITPVNGMRGLPV